ncbi:MAG: hypothetical protein ABEJ74_05630 [Haloferacaceae archaeon]
MTGDRTLDDFLGDAGASPEEDDEEAAGDEEGAAGIDDSDGEADGDDDADNGDLDANDDDDVHDGDVAGNDDGEASTEPSSVDPAVATYRWSPDGAVCEACGETVDRRWLDGESYVCAACKEW